MADNESKFRRIIEIIIIILIAVLLTYIIVMLAFPRICRQTPVRELYLQQITETFSEKDTATVNEIFDFEFSRGFIFEGTESGKTFMSLHKELDIDISKLDELNTTHRLDGYFRIAFVDDNGDYVYHFDCGYWELDIIGQGQIIYPDTTIEKGGKEGDPVLTVEFKSKDYYNNVE